MAALRDYIRPLAESARVTVGDLVALTSDQETALIAAAAALLGALIGGLIPSITTAVFERRRDRADVRQARRLVAAELRTHVSHYDALIERGTYPHVGSDAYFPDDQWSENRALLARHLWEPHWDLLSAYMTLHMGLRSPLRDVQLGGVIPSDQLERLRADRGLAARLFTDLAGRLVED